jgi:hypothetical protein
MKEPPLSSLETPVLRAAHAAEGDWFQDGLENIYRGLILLLLSVDFFVPREQAPLYADIAPFLGLFGMLLFGVLVFAHRSLIEWIKARMTFPRIGYVTPPPSAVGIESHGIGFWPPPFPTAWEDDYLQRRQKLQIWIYALMAVGFVLRLSKVGQHLQDNLGALAWAVALGLTSKYTQPPGRSAWAALAICVAAGIVVVLFPSPGARPVDTLFALLGGVSTFIGTCQLVVFLFRHPLPKPTQS